MWPLVEEIDPNKKIIFEVTKDGVIVRTDFIELLSDVKVQKIKDLKNKKLSKIVKI